MSHMLYNRPALHRGRGSPPANIHTPQTSKAGFPGWCAHDGALRLFPAFASITELDTSTIDNN